MTAPEEPLDGHIGVAEAEISFDESRGKMIVKLAADTPHVNALFAVALSPEMALRLADHIKLVEQHRESTIKISGKPDSRDPD